VFGAGTKGRGVREEGQVKVRAILAEAGKSPQVGQAHSPLRGSQSKRKGGLTPQVFVSDV